MRGSALSCAILGFGLRGALAAPTLTSSDTLAAEVEERQFQIKPPESDFGTGRIVPCSMLAPGQPAFCIPDSIIHPKRQFTLPEDGDQKLKDAVIKIQLRAQELSAKKKRSRAEERELESLIMVLKGLGIKVIKPAPGGSTTITFGRRSEEGGVVEHLGRRQTLPPPPRGPGCLDKLKGYYEEVDQFLEEYFGADPYLRAQIWGTLINESLRLCGLEVGKLKPDPSQPGAPLKPDPVQPGAPLKPDPTTPGAPLKPDPVTSGAPMKPGSGTSE